MMLLPLVIVSLTLAAPDTESERLQRARALLDAMVKNDFATTTTHYDKTMKEKFPPEKARELWEALTKQLGGFKKVVSTSTRRAGSSNIIDLICEFEKSPIKVRVSFDKDDKIEGFFLLPATPPKFDPPPYARADSYREEKFVVGEKGDWPLTGTLTLPKAAGPHPVVVLLHGSGSHDQDETIGPNKPFRDLAWGLAGHGIAVLRFEKRTHAHPSKFMARKDGITLDAEVVEDAVIAARQLRAHKDIDPNRVFILGHSLGALAAPRVGAQDGKLAGLILLAGNSRPLEDLVHEQYTYLYSLDGPLSEKHKEELAELKKKVDRVKGDKLTAETPGKDLPLGAPAVYWLSLKQYDQKATAAKLTMPMLLLQGERDYQVTMEDLAGWKKALAGRKNVTVKSYPVLNHLFMEGKGKARPEEYMQPGHVSKEVIDDVANWVKRPGK